MITMRAGDISSTKRVKSNDMECILLLTRPMCCSRLFDIG